MKDLPKSQSNLKMYIRDLLKFLAVFGIGNGLESLFVGFQGLQQRTHMTDGRPRNGRLSSMTELISL